MSVVPQEALLHGPGLLSGIQIWRGVARMRPEDTRALCARILERLDDEARREGAQCLVALSTQALAGHPAHAALVEERPADVLSSKPRAARSRAPVPALPPPPLATTQGDVFLQIAAPDVECRLHLLRRAQRTLETFCWLDVELLGGRIGDGREAFGFKDGLRAPTHEEVVRDAVIDEGPARGASWILYQRWHQDLEGFKRLREARQADVVGRWPDGAEKEGAPLDAHVRLQRAAAKGAPLVRRGFPFRAGGREGLCFVAASRSARHFETALDAMMEGEGGGPDALLPWVYTREGGVYVAPPDGDWLFEQEDSGRVVRRGDAHQPRTLGGASPQEGLTDA